MANQVLQIIGQIAKEDLDWDRLGTLVGDVRKAIHPFVELDSRKLSSTEAFLTSTGDSPIAGNQRGGGNSLRHSPKDEESTCSPIQK